MNHLFEGIAVNNALRAGARNAINVCLRVQPEEKVTLITDERTTGIAASLYEEIRNTGARCSVHVLEHFTPRPHTDMPREILDDLATSQVSVYAVHGQEGELRTRMQMTDVVTRHRIRHGHMININERIMQEGMRADFHKVNEISEKVLDLARNARYARARTSRGTDIRVEFSPSLKWVKTSGIISADHWGNLPGGEVFTAPLMVNGTFVVDGVVGDYLCARYGDLSDAPLTIGVKDNRVAEVHSDNKELEQEFWNYCHTDENSSRVGEFAIGTNVEVKRVIGHILQDEKIPGVHIAFGHPAGEHTGATWTSSTHIDVVGTNFDIWIEDRQIMEGGEFLI